MPTPLVLFDCDGVLVNTEELAGRVAREALKNIGLDYTDDVFDQHITGTSMDEFRKRVNEDYLAISGMPLPEVFFADMQTLYLEAEALHIKEIEGVRDFIQSLVNSNIPFAVASNSARENIERKLKLVGLYDFFVPHIFSREDVKNGKPAPDIYLHAMRAMGETDPQNCIVVEDSAIGVAAGRAAGMYVIGYAGGDHRRPKYDRTLTGAGADFAGDTMAAVAFEAFDQIDEIKFGAQGRNAAIRAQRRKGGLTPP